MLVYDANLEVHFGVHMLQCKVNKLCVAPWTTAAPKRTVQLQSKTSRPACLFCFAEQYLAVKAVFLKLGIGGIQLTNCVAGHRSFGFFEPLF